MDIAILGASGSVGRETATSLVRLGILSKRDQLTLVGRSGGDGARTLHGLRSELLETYDGSPTIDVAIDPEFVGADLALMCAGRTFSTEIADVPSRDTLALDNVPVFEKYAAILARSRITTGGITLIASNPIELAVDTFRCHLPPERVIGIGTHLDSLRLRAELAHSLGISRRRVQVFAGGEHGWGLVPLYSTLRVQGWTPEAAFERCDQIGINFDLAGFRDELALARDDVRDQIRAGRVDGAYETIERCQPGIRVCLRPFITHYSGQKTQIGVAHAMTDLVDRFVKGDQFVASVQVARPWPQAGLEHPVAVGRPCLINFSGVASQFDLDLSSPEIHALRYTVEEVRAKLMSWRGEAVLTGQRGSRQPPCVVVPATRA
jgi:malate dehydrogenase